MPSRQLLEVIGRPSLECFLRKRRLLFLARLLATGPPSLLALLFGKVCVGSHCDYVPWTRQIIPDFTVIHAALPKLAGLTPPSECLEDWIYFLSIAGHGNGSCWLPHIFLLTRLLTRGPLLVILVTLP